MFRGSLAVRPCLHDAVGEGGDTRSDYFWQDLFVARRIYAASPKRHVDVGSRVDGFVAHVACFRQIEVVDVRPITAAIPGIIFKRSDLMGATKDVLADLGQSDSLSCLHALEHFGLGRYGDPINPNGFRLGLSNMAQILSPGGTLYLSVPIGRERVEYNANWVFDWRTICSVGKENGLTLIELHVFDPSRKLSCVKPDGEGPQSLLNGEDGLGIFIFTKNRLT
jgi:hypothetical protein